VGYGLLPVNCVDGVRMSSALTYLPLPDARPNLRIRCGAEVLDLVFDGSRAVGVRLTDGETVRAGSIVISAGTYLSPCLLLRSGIGPAADLRERGLPVRVDLPGVGANFSDHVGVAIDLRYDAEASPAPLFQVVATLHSSTASSSDPPDLQLAAFGPLPGSNEAPPTFTIMAALLKPQSRGRVTLGPVDGADPVSIDLGYLREPTDLDRLAEGLEIAEQLADDLAVRALGPPLDTPATRVPSGRHERYAWMRRTCFTYHHPVGTCSIGPDSDPEAVVDANGRVRGTEGLYVADASVMPDVPSANTHIPTLMVAERLAETRRGSV
jgi:choline dehydrogenase